MNQATDSALTYHSNSHVRLQFLSFTLPYASLPARRYASAGNSDRNVSVCPSRAGIVSKGRKLAA